MMPAGRVTRWLARTILVLMSLLARPTVDAAASAADFIQINSPRIVLTHVNVIDGTGTSVKPDQTILIENGRIASITPSRQASASPDTYVLELRGHTVIPGLVGMHDHLFYAAGNGSVVSLPRSFARLYLAAGVTTIRTAGTVDLAAEIAIKNAIDQRQEVGPRIHLSSPYLEATSDLRAVEQMIEQFADAGVTSLKAYTTIGTAALAAAIRTAHRRGLKVTGHLCAVGFHEAPLSASTTWSMASSPTPSSTQGKSETNVRTGVRPSVSSRKRAFRAHRFSRPSRR